VWRKGGKRTVRCHTTTATKIRTEGGGKKTNRGKKSGPPGEGGEKEKGGRRKKRGQRKKHRMGEERENQIGTRREYRGEMPAERRAIEPGEAKRYSCSKKKRKGRKRLRKGVGGKGRTSAIILLATKKEYGQEGGKSLHFCIGHGGR